MQPRPNQPASPPQPTQPPQHRNWLGIYFKCCHAYGRLYKTPDGKRYAGRCPRCMAQLHCMVGPEGTKKRFFEAI